MLRRLVLFALSVLAAGGAEAAGFALQPHRAVYDLSLRATRGGSAVEQITGRLVMEMAGACDGYVLNQRIITRMLNTDGDLVLNDFSVSTWENRDGTQFRFSLRNEVNGAPVEEVDGRARLNGPNGAGEAVFTKPEEGRLPLPAGTVFPFEHTMRLLESAAAGKETLGIVVFDGSGQDGLYHTFSVLGAPERGAAEQVAGDALLQGVPSWHVQLAYFPYRPEQRSAAEVPDFEIGFRLFANGVASDLILDYGTFALDGRLADLQALPTPAC